MRCGSEYGWVHEYIFSDDNWNRVWEPWVQRLYNPIHASWFSSSLDGKKLTTYVHSHDGRYSICSPRFYVYVYIVKTLHLNQPSSSSNVYQERCWAAGRKIQVRKQGSSIVPMRQQNASVTKIHLSPIIASTCHTPPEDNDIVFSTRMKQAGERCSQIYYR